MSELPPPHPVSGSPGADEPAALHFRARHRLTHKREFDAVYEARVRKPRGPLMLFAIPNGRGWPRLGLAVGTRVGGAVVRNRWKRILREAFRLQQHTLPHAADGSCYDLIVSVRASPEQRVWPLAMCMDALRDLAADADREWRRRARRDATSVPPPAAPGQE